MDDSSGRPRLDGEATCTTVTMSHNRASRSCRSRLEGRMGLNTDLVLAIDCSTTASKAVAWDKAGVCRWWRVALHSV